MVSLGGVQDRKGKLKEGFTVATNIQPPLSSEPLLAQPKILTTLNQRIPVNYFSEHEKMRFATALVSRLHFLYLTSS